jgi:hypothetical protein
VSDASDAARLSAAEQEVLLCAVEDESLFHVMWGVRPILDRSAGTDLELRADTAALVRKLIDMGWIRLAQRWSDKAPPGTLTPEIFGQRYTVDSIARYEPIALEEFDRVLRDPSAWGLDGPYDVVLELTPEGGRAVERGALVDAYAKITGPKPE